MNSDIARGWILANLISLAVSAVLGLGEYLFRWLLSVVDDDATVFAKAVYIALAAILSALSLAIYARLTGAVLASIIPGLPQRAWLRLHVALGIVVGAGFGLAMLNVTTTDEPLEWKDIVELVFVFCVFAIGGGLLGVLLGSLQALVLRRVARGLLLWIATSALAVGILATLVLICALQAPEGPELMREVMLSGTVLVAGIIGAIVMLPAVLRLRPRSA